MHVELAYGKNGLGIEVPDDRTTIIKPDYPPPLDNEQMAILHAIQNPINCQPLRNLVKRGQTVAISVCDITRPMPSAKVLPVILKELAHLPKEEIVILVATGTHRDNTREELETMLGPEVVRDYSVVVHNGFSDETLRYVGQTSSGIPIWLNKLWLDSDFRITTGFVEPHFFAGFSGGPKMVAPGLAGFETIMQLHSAPLIAHPNATWGVTEGNPIHDAIREIAAKTRVDFSLDVTINESHQITSVHAGELFAAHQSACILSKKSAMQATSTPYDVVITTNSGYPLDINLYQSVKGLSAAAKIVRPGGTIICAVECRDGIPEHGHYKNILTSKNSPKDLLNMILSPGYEQQDQWQVQIQAQVQLKADVLVKSDFLSDEEIRSAHMTPIDDLQDALGKVLQNAGPDATVCVLPQGPQTIAYIT